jgi:hypothetical protein
MDILYTGKLLNREQDAGRPETKPTIGHLGCDVPTYTWIDANLNHLLPFLDLSNSFCSFLSFIGFTLTEICSLSFENNVCSPG